MIKKILPILSAFILIQHITFAQFKEYGIGIGGMSYSGDMARGYHIFNQNLAVQGIYRMNVNKDVALKFGLTYGKISGNDTKPFDILGEIRGASFSRQMLELSTTFEYHFIDYKHEKSTIKWSPYLFGGVGFVKIFNMDRSVDDFSSIQPVIPFGIGIKHLIGKQFTVSMEYGARKMFMDGLDRVSDGDQFIKDYQYGNPNNKDWYHFLGISFSYILYEIPCTYRYRPNKSMYSK